MNLNIQKIPGMQMPKRSDDWWQLIITDTSDSEGLSCSHYVKELIGMSPSLCHCVIYGATWLAELLGGKEVVNGNFYIDSNRLMVMLPRVNQIDWAFISFFASVEKAEEACKTLSTIQMINVSPVTFRFADNHYLYMYTQDKEIASQMEQNHAETEIKTSGFNNLDFPF